MIKSIAIINFESHKSTFIEFDAHLNILSGSSSAGKSSIRRALTWCICNTPSGTAYVSWDNLDAKGKIKNPTQVTVVLQDGTSITRCRSSTLNGYIINDELPLEAVGTSVPERVQALFNFADVNLQRQLDAHFLISETAGETARYLNEVVSLEAADEYQAAIESKRRSTNLAITANAKAVDALSVELKQFDWLEIAEAVIMRLEKMEAKQSKLGSVITQLKASVSDYEREESRLEQCKVVTDAEIYVDKLKKVLSRQEHIQPVISVLESGIIRYKQVLTELELSDMLLRAEKILNKINRFVGIQTEGKKAIQDLGGSVQRYNVVFDDYSSSKRELGVAERELALVPNCPVCGAVRKHEEVIF